MKKIDVKTVITDEMVKKAQQVLVDNGIDTDETATVIQAIGYVLLNTELENLIDWD